MTAWICATCGVEHADTDEPVAVCPICADERQYVPAEGQSWTTQEKLAADGYRLEFEEVEPGLFGFHPEPVIGIGQRSLLVQTADGNLLWDPPTLLDHRAVVRIDELGGVAAIAASHPHMFGAQVAWSHALGSVPIWVNAADERWLQRRDPVIHAWSESREVVPGVTLVQCGGHFPGSAVAHWRHGADGRGVLLSGDTIGGVADTRWVSFMRSYPNLIPLPASAVERIVARLEPYEYARLYALNGRGVEADAKEAVRRSAERYVGWVRGDFDVDA